MSDYLCFGSRLPDHSITANVYKEGWARNGSMVATNSKYGYPLLVKHAGNQEYGGHFSGLIIRTWDWTHVISRINTLTIGK